MTTITIIKIIVMLILISIATYTDVTTRKIPNKLTVPFALIGLVIHTITDFPNGIGTSLLGCLVGLMIFMVPYVMGGMGGGDIKLMAALGAITDARTIVLIALYTALSGGVIIIVSRIKNKQLIPALIRTGKMLLYFLFSILSVILPSAKMESLKNKYNVSHTDEKDDYIPYGVAIAMGTVITIIITTVYG